MTGMLLFRVLKMADCTIDERCHDTNFFSFPFQFYQIVNFGVIDGQKVMHYRRARASDQDSR